MSLVAEVGLVGLHGGGASKRFHRVVWELNLRRRYACGLKSLLIAERVLRSEAEERGFTECRRCWPR